MHASAMNLQHKQAAGLAERQQRAAQRPAWRCTALAADAAPGTSPSQPTASTSSLLALKEWNVTCAALGDGQTVLLRKGGIKEPKFVPQASSFVLFPTSFHTQGALLKPGVSERYQQEMALEPKSLPALQLNCLATITGAWATHDPMVLQATDPLHVWGPEFLEARLKWRSKQPITILELRCHRLAEPLLVPTGEDLWGCFSWLDLGQRAASGTSGQQPLPGAAQLLATPGALVPALGDVEFATKQALLRDRLAGLSSLEEVALPV